jgi:hypothetical protein
MGRLAARSGLLQARAIGVGTLLVASLYLALIHARLVLNEHNPAVFAPIGTTFVDPAALPTGYVVVDGNGVDGQFYLRLALDPFTDRLTEYGIRIDNPPYRQQRILYPTLAWVLAFGHPDVVPSVLVAINFLGLCALAIIGGLLALHFGRHPAWGLFLPLYPGFVVSLVRDLTEIVATCCLGAALLVLLRPRRRLWLVSLLLCCAALSRETTLLVPAGLLAASVPVIARRLGVPTLPWYVGGAPLLVFSVWQAVMWGHWGTPGLLAGGDNFARPLDGIVHFMTDTPLLVYPPAAWMRVFELASGTLMALFVLAGLRQTRVNRCLQVAWVGYGVLGLLLSYAVWQYEWHVWRALVEWHLLGLVILLGTPWRLATLPLLALLPLWVWNAMLGAAT